MSAAKRIGAWHSRPTIVAMSAERVIAVRLTPINAKIVRNQRGTSGRTAPGFGTSVAQATHVSDRDNPRQSVFLLARLRRGDIDVAARVRNISAGGLMIDRLESVTLSRDELVTLEIHGLGLQLARVAWHSGERIGLAFERTVDPARVLRGSK